jgi:hypothetical protein
MAGFAAAILPGQEALFHNPASLNRTSHRWIQADSSSACGQPGEAPGGALILDEPGGDVEGRRELEFLERRSAWVWKSAKPSSTVTKTSRSGSAVFSRRAVMSLERVIEANPRMRR